MSQAAKSAVLDAPAAPVAVTPRISNPALVLPDAWPGIQQLLVAIQKGGVPEATLALSHQRASQINGCGACLEFGLRHSRKLGETDVRMFTVAGWRESPHFTAAERAALELTEAVTRMADRADPVPDEVWNLAAEYYTEKQMAALVLSIGLTNLFNRINVSTRQVVDE